MKTSITSNAQIIKHWGKILEDYQQIKKGNHKYFKTCKELYDFYRISAKQVLKYHKRFLKSDGNIGTLLPQKRGARIGSNRTPKNVPLIQGVAEIITPHGFNNSFILCMTFGVSSTKWSR